MPLSDGNPPIDYKAIREGHYLKLKQSFSDFKDFYEKHEYLYSLKEMKKIEKYIKKLEELL